MDDSIKKGNIDGNKLLIQRVTANDTLLITISEYIIMDIKNSINMIIGISFLIFFITKILFKFIIENTYNL